MPIRSRSWCALFLLGALVFPVSAALAAEPAAAPPLIPREVLFGNPERAGVQISPDGSKIGFRAAVDGVMNVWVGPIGDPAAAKPVTHDTSRGIRSWFFAYTSQHVVYAQDKGGDENWRIYVVDLASGVEKDMTPFEKTQARIELVSPLHPDEILVGLNNRNERAHDLHRLNVRTGKLELVQQNEEYVGFTTDADYRVHLASRFTADGGLEILRAAEGGFQPFATVASEDALTTSPLGFDKAGKILYLLDSRGRDTGALTRVDLATGKSEVVFASPKADVADVIIHPSERTLQAVKINYLRGEWTVLDPTIADDFAALAKVSRGDFEVTSRTADDRVWTVVYVPDDGPVTYYLWDRTAKKARYLFSNRPALEGLRLAQMLPREIRSRDGLTLVSYLSLPPGSDPDGDGRPASPLPMVLDVHGGPWGRDEWGFNPYHQWLANRGYAVLSVNFRASTGFGKAFTNAGDRQWGATMHDDLIDAVDWAVAEKIADAKKVAIMGGSYGGYATLAGLTFTPEKFAAGVDIVGPSNLVTLLQSIPPYWAPLLNVFKKRMGDVDSDEGRKFLESRSPLFKADRIQRPLLIGQGANDPRVKQAEADQIVQAMKAKGLPVTYVLFPDEGHGFARPANNKAFNAVAEAFLAQYLGGRYEPIGKDFEGSSLTVPEGAAGVPGVAAALAK